MPAFLDMGCGLGATLSSIACRLPSADLHSITLVLWQLEQGRLLNQSGPQTTRIQLSLGNYEHTNHSTESFDALCHREQLLRHRRKQILPPP